MKKRRSLDICKKCIIFVPSICSIESSDGEKYFQCHFDKGIYTSKMSYEKQNVPPDCKYKFEQLIVGQEDV